MSLATSSPPPTRRAASSSSATPSSSNSRRKALTRKASTLGPRPHARRSPHHPQTPRDLPSHHAAPRAEHRELHLRAVYELLPTSKPGLENQASTGTSDLGLERPPPPRSPARRQPQLIRRRNRRDRSSCLPPHHRFRAMDQREGRAQAHLGRRHPRGRPLNAQATRLAERLAATGARVGTVDKFQGQEAAIVIYSMATSRPEDAPRGMEFLYSLNRLNVATSRARCAAILVMSPGAFAARMQNAAPDEAGECAVQVPGDGRKSSGRRRTDRVWVFRCNRANACSCGPSSSRGLGPLVQAPAMPRPH